MSIAIGLVAISVQVLAAPTANAAANAADFQPGNIISDAVFYNANAMSESDIQAFLNSKVPTCQSGATCLKNFSQTTTSRAADPMCAAYSGASNESAARIIYKVAQACGINPQVILVTLQKEQGLVTSSYPSSWAWTASMGYACPDTGSCDTQYYGFYNQVYMGAWQFKRYGNPPGTSNYFTWYPVGSYANVLFSPDVRDCGSSSVYIANKATAALYYYTPYQPDAPALAAGYGTAPGDVCATYGNRNFYLYFTDWFGSTGSIGPAMIDAAYSAQGGATGPLGAALTSYITIADNGGGIVRGYANGAITWTKSAGAVIISGTIRDYFNAQGGIAGNLGWPTSNQNPFSANGGGQVQGFQYGVITLTTTTGPRVLAGAVRIAYNALGSISGPLGWPAGDQSCTSAGTCTQAFQQATLTVTKTGVWSLSSSKIDAAYAAQGGATGKLGAAQSDVIVIPDNGGGLVKAYKGGAIASSATGGTHVVSGSIRDYFNQLGGLSGYLAWPSADAACDTGNTCSQAFQGGTIYIAPNGTTTAIGAQILALYNSLGGTTGSLGAPVGTTSSIPANGGGLVQGFANGAITSTAASGAVALTGAIRAAYATVGGLTGSFGWPATATTTFTDNGGGIVQGFQYGAILGASTGGVYPLSGDLRTAYNSAGGVAGTLGWPETGPISTSGGLVQAFQNGALTWAPGAGAHVLSGAFRTAYATTGGIGGTIGWPTSDVTAQSIGSGGQVQGFQLGAITQKTGGSALVLSGAIRTFFNANGGLAGKLGWPTSSMTCTSSASCSQTFDGGTVDWSQSLGAHLR